MAGETDPLLPTTSEERGHGEAELSTLTKTQRWKVKSGEAIESRNFHHFIIALIIIDATCVITDLSWVFLNRCVANGDIEDLPEWLEVLARISFGINTVFLFEIPVALFAFGWRYYAPFSPQYTHSGFHLFDALVILGSFVSEAFLSGKEEELAGLLVILRLWRIVKVVGGVAVGVSEYNEEDVKEVRELRVEVRELREKNRELSLENEDLKKKAGANTA